MSQKVIFAMSRNVSPEEELAKRLASLGPGWRVVSATTSMLPWGEMMDGPNRGPLHVYFMTTVVVEATG